MAGSNWWDLSNLSAWPNTTPNNADSAIFSYGYDTGLPAFNTVTVSSGIRANQLRFNRSGYTLAGGNLTIEGVTPTLFAQMGESATIGSDLLGAAELFKSGGGSIRLTGNNAGLSGALTIAGGSLVVNSVSALPGSGTISVTSGNDTPSSTSLLGLTGGTLVLDGTGGGLDLSRDLNLEGRGAAGDRSSSVISLGDNTLSGTITTAFSSIVPLTFRNSRINSMNGTLTLSGTLVSQGTSASTFVTLGTFRVAANTTATFNSRNGFGFTLGAWTQESSNSNNTVTNNMGGSLCFTGDAWNNSDSGNRTLTMAGGGNTVISGNINTSGAGLKTLTKNDTGTLTINGTGSTLNGPVNITNGEVAIRDFRSLNNNSAMIALGSSSSTASLVFINPIDLGAAQRTVSVTDNSNTGADFATLAGVISGAGGGIVKTGSNSVLRLTGANTYTGVTDINVGTLVVSSLGNSSDPSNTPTSVGRSGISFDNSNAITIGNGSTSNAILQYVGPGEVSNRKIRINASTGSSAGAQIHADGSGPLILTNVSNDMVLNTGSKSLWLRGSNTAGNMITSQLSDNGGPLNVNIDGGATWILRVTTRPEFSPFSNCPRIPRSAL